MFLVYRPLIGESSTDKTETSLNDDVLTIMRLVTANSKKLDEVLVHYHQDKLARSSEAELEKKKKYQTVSQPAATDEELMSLLNSDNIVSIFYLIFILNSDLKLFRT